MFFLQKCVLFDILFEKKPCLFNAWIPRVHMAQDIRDDDRLQHLRPRQGYAPVTTDEGLALARNIGACYFAECSASATPDRVAEVFSDILRCAFAAKHAHPASVSKRQARKLARRDEELRGAALGRGRGRGQKNRIHTVHLSNHFFQILCTL